MTIDFAVKKSSSVSVGLVILGVEGELGEAERRLRCRVDEAGATPCCFRGDMFLGLFDESGMLYSAVNEEERKVSKSA